jgi:N6-adenosine-specific RNA methylase IME4
MIDLPLLHYGLLMVDPPNLFENWSEAGEDRNPNQHYDCMTEDDILDLPIGHLASRDAIMLLWTSAPFLLKAIRQMAHWGFEYKTVGFTWVKTCSVATEKFHFGPGYWTRANPELCLLGTTGQPARLSAAVPELIVSPVREHSRKPDEAYERAMQLAGGPYADIFSRERRPGWDSWGREVGKFDVEAAA